MYEASCVREQKAYSKHTKGSISPNSIDLLYLQLIQVPRSLDLANFVSTMTIMTAAVMIELIALPFVHARRVMSMSDTKIVYTPRMNQFWYLCVPCDNVKHSYVHILYFLETLLHLEILDCLLGIVPITH